MRQIVLDTETTGLEVGLGHRIIEIGCVELVNRRLTGRNFHKYVNPNREIDDGALEVHGITQEFMADKPVFADIWEELQGYIGNDELIIHNAPFDLAFLDHEIALLDSSYKMIKERCSIIDSLVMARKKHPGQRNNLDALCRRYSIDNSQRILHGALLDAEILSDIYLMLSGGQTGLFEPQEKAITAETKTNNNGSKTSRDWSKLPEVKASKSELQAHQEFIDFIDEKNSEPSIWSSLAKSD